MKRQPPKYTLFPFPPKKKKDRKSTRLNSSHSQISYAVFCLKKKIYSYDQIGSADVCSRVTVNSRRPAAACTETTCPGSAGQLDARGSSRQGWSGTHTETVLALQPPLRVVYPHTSAVSYIHIIVLLRPPHEPPLHLGFTIPPQSPLLCRHNSVQLLALFTFFFLNDTAPPEIYPLPLHDALPIFAGAKLRVVPPAEGKRLAGDGNADVYADHSGACTVDHVPGHTAALCKHGGCISVGRAVFDSRSEEHTSELQSQSNLVCRLLLEK